MNVGRIHAQHAGVVPHLHVSLRTALPRRQRGTITPEWLCVAYQCIDTQRKAARNIDHMVDILQDGEPEERSTDRVPEKHSGRCRSVALRVRPPVQENRRRSVVASAAAAAIIIIIG